MPEVFKSPQAYDDLSESWCFIAVDNVAAADRLIDRIDEKLRSLAEAPGVGTPRPELGTDVRSFVVGRYVLFYRPAANGIEVIHVLHGARDIKAVFESQ